MLSLLKSILTIIGVNHYVCCVWVFLGKTEFADYPSWTTAHSYPQFGDGTNRKMINAPWGYLYFTSLHWAISQFTPGGIHIHPQNIAERLYTIICLLFGMVVFSSFLANVTQAPCR
jgi:hypothetical protein